MEGKRGLDTFASTNLDFMLRSKGIKTDGVAARSIEEHDNALASDFPMFSKP